jgi:hypothetical protein
MLRLNDGLVVDNPYLAESFHVMEICKETNRMVISDCSQTTQQGGASACMPVS